MRPELAKGFQILQAYLRLHLLTAAQYPAGLAVRLLGNLLNDATWLAFWWLMFHRFTSLRGWEVRDVFVLWSVCGLGFSLASGFTGNFMELARIVSEGGLDYYLQAPGPPLFHLLVSRMEVESWLEAAFWAAVFAVFVSPAPAAIGLYLAASAMVGAVFASVGVLAGSLAFVAGSAEGLAREVVNVFVTLATYPPVIFRGAARVLIFTLIPAGFVSLLPVELIRSPGWLPLALLAGFSSAMVGAAWLAFHSGRRSYESGSVVRLRL
ncbi:MAG: ABC-2 family transporter protein [Acetobacteraceae bacterium]|nr:ABC-2 family transporter protein [Acetobacteraceae bacterium]